MKAVYIEKFGGPDVLKYGDLPDPVPGPGEVVVDVHAASVNGADWKVRVGDYKQTKFPLGQERQESPFQPDHSPYEGVYQHQQAELRPVCF